MDTVRTQGRVERVGGGLAALVVAGALAACGPTPGTDPSGTTSSSTSSSSSSSGAKDRPAVLGTIAEKLGPNTFGGVLAAADGTTVRPVKVPWLTGWTVQDLRSGGAGTPQRLIVAVQDGDDEVLVLSGTPENVSKLSRGTKVADAGAATTRARDYLELSRLMSELSYPVDSTRDIRWLKQPTAHQGNIRDATIEEFRSKVRAPKARAAGSGWQVTVWRMRNADLEKHVVTVGRDGSLSDDAEVASQKLPVVVGA